MTIRIRRLRRGGEAPNFQAIHFYPLSKSTGWGNARGDSRLFRKFGGIAGFNRAWAATAESDLSQIGDHGFELYCI